MISIIKYESNLSVIQIYMESNHPFAKVNTTRDPHEIISDTDEVKWGYSVPYSAT